MFTEEMLELASGRQQLVYRGGDGPPLVWLHPLSGFEADHPLLTALAERYTVLAPTAPGFHDLTEVDELRDVHELALHYDDVFEAAGLTEATVVGHSFGAMLAAEYASHYPRRVSRLVLISALGLWHDDYPVSDIFALSYPDLAKVIYAEPPALDEDVETMVSLVRGMTAVAKYLWPIPDRGLARRLYRITAPTLVVHGEQDAFIPAQYADDLAAGIRDARTVIIPGAGHMVPEEQPDTVRQQVLDFLAR